MARMSIDDKFPRDPRVIRLGKAVGWSRRETIGALIDVFQIAYDRELDVLPELDIDTAAERDGFTAAMIEVGLAERVRRGIRIKGAGSRIKYLTEKSQAGKIGGVKSGESRRNNREAQRSTASSTPEASRNPPDPVPDDPSVPVPDPADFPDQIQALSPARSPKPVPGGDPHPDGMPTREDRKAVRDAIRAEINAARERVGAKLETALNPLLPFDRGLDSDLAGQLSLATTRPALEALAAQARHAVAMAELEAIAEPERVQFLTGAIFAGGNFARLAGKTAATARLVGNRSRNGPRGAAERDIRFGAVQPSDPSCYPDGEQEIT